MSVFTVDLKNQPGEPARLFEAMARGEEGTVVFIADDEASAETVPQDADIQYTLRPALTIRMENQPGVSVNADLLLPVRVSGDLFFAVICVDDACKARRARCAGYPRGRLRAVGPAVRSVGGPATQGAGADSGS